MPRAKSITARRADEPPKSNRSLGRTKRLYVPSHFYPHIGAILDQARPALDRAIALRHGDQTVVVPKRFEDFVQERFYIPQTGEPAVLMPHQVAYSRLVLDKDATNHFPYQTVIYSTIKQSGKSTWSGMVARWYAETGVPHSELYAIGNDREQAKGRGFREVRRSLELTPGFDKMHERLPGEWVLQKETMTCVRTGTEIRALPVDAKGEAGGKPAIQIWTELWGVEHEEGRRFWDELTPIPTIPDSFRIVETYAGFLQESELLLSLYETARSGHQLTSGELHERTGVPMGCFVEAPEPDDLVPIWENKAAGICMYWDSGDIARRMPWQHGERAEAYYREQENTLPAPAYLRLHRNEWVSSTDNFIRAEWWDACAGDVPPLLPGDKEPLVVGVDAATTGDCFAIVVVSRHPERHDEVMVRAVRVFDPKESGGVVDYSEPEAFLRFLAQGGHYADDGSLHPVSLRGQNGELGCERCAAGDFDVPGHNVVQICYDPYQLESTMQRLRTDEVAWCEEFSQAGDRLRADRALYDAILGKRLTHSRYNDPNNPDPGAVRLRSHILNAGAKVQKDQDSTLRLVKVSSQRKIDAAVALSMASARCLYLVL